MSSDRQTSSKAHVERAVRRMNPELKSQYDAARRLLATATASDVRARYGVGQIVVDISKSADRYGMAAVRLLSEALARDETTLYRYAAVARAWDEREIETVLMKRMPGGEPLSWSHLHELAVIESPDKRERLLNEALVRGLSSRELSALARGGGLARTEGLPPSLSRLRRLAAACASMDRFAVDDALVERLLASGPSEASEILGEALNAQIKAIHLLERNVLKLRKVSATLRKPVAVKVATKLVAAGDTFVPRVLWGGTP